MSGPWEDVLEEIWRRSRFTSYFYQSVEFVPSQDIPTIALTVMNRRLAVFYNPGFPQSMETEELIGLLVHEMLHVVFSHDHRAIPDGDLYLQNLAQDMVVNSYITERNNTFFSRRSRYSSAAATLVLPHGLPMVPREFMDETGITDPAWEQVYLWLKNIPRGELKRFKGSLDGTEGDTQGAEIQAVMDNLNNALENVLGLPRDYMNDETWTRLGNMDGLVFEDSDGNQLPTGIHILPDHDYRHQVEAKKKQLIMLPGRDLQCQEERAYQELKGIIQEIRVIDTSSWEHMIKSLVDYSSQSNEWTYTYGRFNRRYFSQGIYAPGRIFMEKQIITVVVDVSASMVMTPGDLQAAFGVLEEMTGKYMINLLCIDENLFVPEKRGDSFVRSTGQKRYIYKKGDWRLIKTGSSGTTFFAPLFNSYLRGHHEMLVVITDGYIYDLPQLKRYSPTLWLIPPGRPDPFVPPFGQAVRMEVKR